jgi:transglutaminase-like putative cysteine protease
MRRLQCALVTAVHLTLACAAIPAQADSTETALPAVPVPAWVSRVPVEGSWAAPTSGSDGVVDELLDEEVRLGDTVERYSRHVQRLTSTAGVATAGQIEIPFEPSYEHLRLHGVVIGRGAQRIDALKRASVRILQRENDLGRQVYDGTLTALIVVNDLRVGDTLDVEYSVEGANPVFNGRFVDNAPLTTAHGVEHLRIRALFPESRQIAARSIGLDLPPTEHVENGVRELVWDRRSVPAPSQDDRIPTWFVTYPYLTFSELTTWGDVARWASPLFAEAMAETPAITAKAAEIAGSTEGREARARAALRFVQDEVRYLGIEMGVNSHRPHDAAQVLEQRFGDCKDKAVLLVSLLRALGIEAEPALVNTWSGRHTSSFPPSATAFDHAIVHLRRDGLDLWVDPTRSQQRGPLAGTPVTYGEALIVAPTSTDLTVIAEVPPNAPTTESRETFVFDGPSAALEVSTTYRGPDADGMRQLLARRSREMLSADYLEFYATLYPKIEATAPLDVTEDPVRDQLILTERYALKDPLGQGGFDLLAASVRELARKPRVTRRATPLAVPFPVFRRDEIVVRGVSLGSIDDQALHDDALDFSRRSEQHEDLLKVTFELRSKRDFVPPDAVASHVALLGQILDSSAGTVGVTEVAPTRAERNRTLIWGWGTVGAILTIPLALVAVRKIRRRKWTRKVRVQAGETAASAHVAADRAAAERLLLGAKCACGGSFAATGEWSTLAYGGREVTAGRATCATCGERRSRYFEGGLAE